MLHCNNVTRKLISVNSSTNYIKSNKVFERLLVKRFVLCYQTVVCPVLSVCDVGALWIKMPFGMRVGLGPGHIVLGGDPA